MSPKAQARHARLNHIRQIAAASPLADNPLLLAVAGIGFSVSFQTISDQAAAHGLPGWHPLYPIGIDIGILALILEARKLIQRGRSDLVPRVLAWGLSIGTIYVNVHGSPGHDWLGRTLHAIMPCLWIVFLELTRWRQRADVRKVEKADPIPLARWLLSPWRTAKLKRRMVTQNVSSYRLAAALEDARLHMRDLARAHYGRGRWRKEAPSLLRTRIRQGRLGDDATVAVTEAVESGRTTGWEAKVREAVAKAITDGDKLTADVKRERRQPGRQIDRQADRQPDRRKPVSLTAQKRAKAVRLLTANPRMPLAEVMAKAGVSESTVTRIKREMPTPLHAATGGVQ
jgi:hypothetical protein